MTVSVTAQEKRVPAANGGRTAPDESADADNSLEALQQQLGYHFDDLEILCRALTHRSYLQDGIHAEDSLSAHTGSGTWLLPTAETPEGTPTRPCRADRTGHNERLEFLGDAVLGLTISDLLFRRYPDQPEGALSHWRSTLVNTHSLARIGHRHRLGRFLHMGRGELLSGGRGKSSLLGNTVEALLGAIYLDGGYPAAYAVIERLFAEVLRGCQPGQWEKDYKSMLQERLQGAGLSLPDYQLVTMEGAPHERVFQIACVVNLGTPDRPLLSRVGYGRSKRSAEQSAAKAVLVALAADPSSADGGPPTAPSLSPIGKESDIP
ncbi:MAG: ribonuclease III [Magnetococcus sp. MYC-9]